MTVIPSPISVVVSIYNEPIEWLAESVNSILAQTFTDFEFVIINDNPNREENKLFLSELQKADQRVVVIENETNIGLTKSLNKGLRAAKGKYIARMDADDIADPERFSKQYQFMEENPDYIVVGSNMYTYSDGQIIKEIIYPADDAHIKIGFLLKDPVAHPASFIRAKALKENNVWYNENMRYAQDLALWCDLTPYGKFHNVQEFLLKYRVSSSQISTSKFGEQAHLKYGIRRKYYDEVFPKLSINGSSTSKFSKFVKVLFGKKISVMPAIKLLIPLPPYKVFHFYYKLTKKL